MTTIWSLGDAALLDQLNQDSVNLALAVSIDYPVLGMVRTHSGVGDLEISGHMYSGVGQLGEVSPVSQGSESQPGELTLTLSGLDGSLLTEVMNTRCQGAKIKVWLVVLNDDHQAQGAALLFTGRLSTQRIAHGETSTIEVVAVDRMADWQRVSADRFSDESHQQRHPGDRLFRYVSQMVERPIYWGSNKDAPGFRYE